MDEDDLGKAAEAPSGGVFAQPCLDILDTSGQSVGGKFFARILLVEVVKITPFVMMLFVIFSPLSVLVEHEMFVMQRCKYSLPRPLSFYLRLMHESRHRILPSSHKGGSL